MMLSCDVKSKEERVQCKENYENERMKPRENVGIKFWNETHEKIMSEVMKQIDSTRNMEEHTQMNMEENRRMLI